MMQKQGIGLKLCPSCNAFQDATKVECPNCGYDLTNVAVEKREKKSQGMKKVMKNVFLGISAIVSIAVVSKIVGHPPRGVEQFILYAFPGGILMFFIFDPLVKALGGRMDDKPISKSESIGKAHHVKEKASIHMSDIAPTTTKEPSQAPDMTSVQTTKNTVLEWFDNHPLEIGALSEFRKGQQDFSSWGNGVIVGSRDWIAEKLAATLAALNGGPPSLSQSIDYSWQQSKLAGFTVRIQVSLPNGLLGGYYIGRVGDDRYGLFGFGIDFDDEQIIAEKASTELSATAVEAAGEVASPAQTKLVTPEYPEWMSAIPSDALHLKIEADREVLPFGKYNCPVCGEFFGNLPLASQNVICRFNYGMKGIAGGAPQDFANFWWTKVEHCGRSYLVGVKGTH